jgi:hypothetical protein
MRFALRGALIAGSFLITLACSKQSANVQSRAVPETHAVEASSNPNPAGTSSASSTAVQIQNSTAATAAASQGSARRAAHDESVGPLHVSGQTFTFVKHVRTTGGPKPAEPKPVGEATVEWWELRDAVGKTVYRAEYGYTVQNSRFDTTEDVGARELKTKSGQGILIDGQGLPSAPNTGSWVQVFGLFDEKLLPLSSPVSTEGEFLEEDVDAFQPSVMFKGSSRNQYHATS